MDASFQNTTHTRIVFLEIFDLDDFGIQNCGIKTENPLPAKLQEFMDIEAGPLRVCRKDTVPKLKTRITKSEKVSIPHIVDSSYYHLVTMMSDNTPIKRDIFL